MGGCMEVPKCCVESEMGGGEEEGSVVCEGMGAWEEDGEEPEVADGWWVATVVMVVSSSSSEISMSSPEECGDD